MKLLNHHLLLHDRHNSNFTVCWSITVSIHILSTVYQQPLYYICSRRLLFFLPILLSAFLLEAQQHDGESGVKYGLKAGVILAPQLFIDKNFSSLPYSGNATGYSLTGERRSKKAIHTLTGAYTSGQATTALFASSTAGVTNLRLDYSLLYPFTKLIKAHFELAAGAAVSYLYTHRHYSDFINNTNSFESIFSFCGMVQGVYHFKGRLEGFSVTEKMFLPFISSLAQPSYGSQDFGDELNSNSNFAKSFLHSNHVVSFGQYLRVVNSLVLRKSISARQAISTEYKIDFYHIYTPRPVKNFSAQFSICYQLIL